MHTTGVDGIYTVTAGNPANLALDSMTGTLDIENSLGGDYTITNTIQGCGNLVISGVIDGPLTGGTPKAIELYALDDIVDLSTYSIGTANNGGGSDGEEFTFPAVGVAAGEFIYVTSNTVPFDVYFGDIDAQKFITTAALINGDDAVELFCNGIVIDVFGDIDTDGSGEAWDYLDGWAYRVDDTAPNAGNFDSATFTYSGINVLDGAADNATSAAPFPIGTYSATSAGICPNSTFSVDISVEDVTDPTIVCPADIMVELAAGECEVVVEYEVLFDDNCGLGLSFVELLENGGFEAGDFSAWEVLGPDGAACDQNWIVSDEAADFCVFGTVGPLAAPAEGTWGAYAAADAGAPLTRELRQNITIPDDAVEGRLTFDLTYDIDLLTFCTGCMTRKTIAGLPVAIALR